MPDIGLTLGGFGSSVDWETDCELQAATVGLPLDVLLLGGKGPTGDSSLLRRVGCRFRPGRVICSLRFLGLKVFYWIHAVQRFWVSVEVSRVPPC